MVDSQLLLTETVIVTGSAVDSVGGQCHGSIRTEIKVVTLQRVKMGTFAKIQRSYSQYKIRQNSFRYFTFVTSDKLNTSVRHFYKDIVKTSFHLTIRMKKVRSNILQR